jgi:hypothetical protein
LTRRQWPNFKNIFDEICNIFFAEIAVTYLGKIIGRK